MVIQTCALCLNEKELRKSHSIPNSFFKKLYRNSEGKAVVVSDDDESLVKFSSDSWWDYLLCQDCEALINNNFERDALPVLRGKHASIVKTKNGVYFTELDVEKLLMLLISIFWRATKSNHTAYKKLLIEDKCDEIIRKSLFTSAPLPKGLLSVKLSKLIDKTLVGGFKPEHLSNIIMSPFYRHNENKQLSFHFLFEGFFIEVFFPGLKKSRLPGVLYPGINELFCPNLNIFDIPEVVDVMVSGLKKQMAGKVTFKK